MAELEELGAKIVLFSPLTDSHLPPCDAVILPGGYPELFAAKLANNTQLRSDLRDCARRNIPIYGECGGFMYLMENLILDDGIVYPMCGLLPFSCRMNKSLQALGYRKGHLMAPVFESTSLSVRAHEFHYASIIETNKNVSGSPLWACTNQYGDELGANGWASGTVFGSWLHIYPLGARSFLKAFCALATKRHKTACP